MGKGDERRSFPARTAAWPQVRDFVETRCAAMGLARSAALRLELVAEELFLNIAEHGHGDSGEPVMMELVDAGEEVEMTLEDSAAEFNPFDGVQQPADTGDATQRPVGGLGRPLVVGLTSRREYTRTGRGNRVTVAVRKAVGAAQHRA